MSNPNLLATISSTTQLPPPRWALLQRQLIEAAGRSVKPFLERYTRDDGTLVWRKKFPGMDGSDDAYEGFNTFSLLYALGGDEHLRDLGLKQYDAITRQFGLWTLIGKLAVLFPDAHMTRPSEAAKALRRELPPNKVRRWLVGGRAGVGGGAGHALGCPQNG